MMKWIIAGLLFIFLVSGCMPYSDPYQQRAAADAAIMATQAAYSERAQVATLEAGKIQNELSSAATAQALQVLQAQATESARQTQAAEATAAEQSRATATAAYIQTSTAWPITQTPLAATQAAIIRADEEAARRAKWAAIVTPIKAILPTLFWGALAVLAVVGLALAYRRLMPVVELRMRTIPHGQGGDVLVLFANMIADPARMFGPALRILPDGAQSTGHAPDPAYQAGVTSRAQLVNLARAMTNQPAQARQMTRRALEGITENAPEPRPALPIILPSRAPWRMLDTWRGGALPLGINQSGLILANPEITPHLLFAGTTGSGKTRYGLRPVIAGALADGWQVIILDRSGLDFLPFQGHGNAHLIKLTDPAEAVGYLRSLFGEVQRRFDVLTQAGVSTWGRLPDAGPRVLAVVDEFSNLADSLDTSGRDELWRQARTVAAEGRKAGVHLALALQDPTHRSIDLRIRRNASPVAFKVRDMDASRVVLGASGAEALPERQFIAVLAGALVRGTAFAPEDEEIAGFLAAHPAAVLPAPGWLQAEPTAAADAGRDAQAEHIRQLKAAGLSLNQIQDEVFSYRGGAAYAAVKSALSGDTTTTGQVIPAQYRDAA